MNEMTQFYNLLEFVRKATDSPLLALIIFTILQISLAQKFCVETILTHQQHRYVCKFWPQKKILNHELKLSLTFFHFFFKVLL